MDLNQMLRSSASDQGLHCLPVTQQFYTHLISQIVKIEILSQGGFS